MGSISGALRRLTGRAAPSPPAVDPRLADLDHLSEADRRIAAAALPLTLTSVARLQALIDAVRYCVARGIPGDFAECGVWRGGSVLAMVLTLRELGVADRRIHLYDTFEGMTAPTEHDVSDQEGSALELWEQGGGNAFDHLFDPEQVGVDAVRRTLLSTGYPEAMLHLVPGPVESTLPDHPDNPLALLRLDTDWHESTRDELEHLYPRLSPGGVLIVDDYGHWEGARRAVDEYFAGRAEPLLLNRIDYTGRIAIKA